MRQRSAIISATLLAGLCASAGSSAAWTKQEERSRVDGTVRVRVVQAATEPMVWNRTMKATPEATVECEAGIVSLWIDFGRKMYGQVQTIVYRIDDEPPRRVNMLAAVRDQSLGLTGLRAVALAQQLLGKRMLHLRATPLGGRDVEVSFSLAGYDAALKPVAAACKWTLPEPAQVAAAEPPFTPTPPEIAALISAQIDKCWATDTVSNEARRLAVIIEAKIDRDGKVREAKVFDDGRMRNNPALARAALRALAAFQDPQCQPFRLPAAQYEQWKHVRVALRPD